MYTIEMARPEDCEQVLSLHTHWSGPRWSVGDLVAPIISAGCWVQCRARFPHLIRGAQRTCQTLHVTKPRY